jgi:Transglutaminase-like superfamily
MSKLQRLRQLSPRDWVVLSESIGCCLAISLALRAVKWQRLSQAITAGSHRRLLRRLPFFHLTYAMEDLAPLVDLASAVTPRNRCLVRSLILLWMLQARGENAELVLGVRKRAGNFEAHAWTRSERGLVGEGSDAIADFAVMTSSQTYREL